MNEAWVEAWRNHVAPRLSKRELESLMKGLSQDDPRIVQGHTVYPSPYLPEQPPSHACPLAWCLWQADDCKTSRAVWNRFRELSGTIGADLDGRAALGVFLKWVDDTPRLTMRRALLAEVESASNVDS